MVYRKFVENITAKKAVLGQKQANRLDLFTTERKYRNQNYQGLPKGV